MKPLATMFTMLLIALSIGAYSYLIRPVLNPTPSSLFSTKPLFASTSSTELACCKNDTILAYSIGKMISGRGKTPRPDTDKVKVGDTCPQCKGTGREPGDGTVDISCGQCKGDGRVDKSHPFFGVSLEEIKEDMKLRNPEPDSFPSYQRIEITEEKQKRITVNIEGIVYTYDHKNGLFYMPDRSRILSIDPIMPDDIDKFKAIETCLDANGLCKQYLIRDE